jgi:alkanesulfonate monooxygenase SsuD/methylene tetrahydromethanopterin reductase-like flavin-dependent oxidoreductase (luciferase family)
VLDLHGWGDLQPQLNALSKQGRWAQMANLVSDEMLRTIAACGTPAQIAGEIRDRVAAAGGADTVCLYQPGPIAADVLAAIVAELSDDDA